MRRPYLFGFQALPNYKVKCISELSEKSVPSCNYDMEVDVKSETCDYTKSDMNVV